MLRVILLFSIVFTAAHARCIHFFRKDYQYIEQYDAFYKMHWDTTVMNWDSAFAICEEEQSKLFYPSTKDEWSILKNLTNQLKEKPNVTNIFLGVHDVFALGEFITIDGQSTPTSLLSNEITPDEHHCVVMDIETGISKVDDCESQDTARPFVCKKLVAKKQSCPTVDEGYFYSKDLNKCYKVNERQNTWQEAMKICYLEGGILAIINQTDIQYISKTAENNDYFVGFRKMFGNTGYYTVKGQRLEKSAYEMSSQVTNYNTYNRIYGDQSHSKTGDCGILVTNSKRLGTENCYKRLPFICEMEVMA